MADITSVLRRPHLVSDERLRRNIVDCLHGDAYCGPSVEKITQVASASAHSCRSRDRRAQASGLEFEQILKDKLAQLGCDIYDGAFFDEVCVRAHLSIIYGRACRFTLQFERASVSDCALSLFPTLTLPQPLGPSQARWHA
jgi:hypothetical protein